MLINPWRRVRRELSHQRVAGVAAQPPRRVLECSTRGWRGVPSRDGVLLRCRHPRWLLRPRAVCSGGWVCERECEVRWMLLLWPLLLWPYTPSQRFACAHLTTHPPTHPPTHPHEQHKPVSSRYSWPNTPIAAASRAASAWTPPKTAHHCWYVIHTPNTPTPACAVHRDAPLHGAATPSRSGSVQL